MTTLADRPGTALVVIDVQKDVVAGNHDVDAVVARVGSLVDRARSSAVPVVWVQHTNPDEGLVEGSPGWEYVDELVRADGEAVVHKRYGDSFEGTDLEQVLAGLGVGSLVVAGAQTDACIRSTLHGAVARGYDALLVSDAHTTEDLSAYGAPPPEQVISHTNLYWSFTEAPGRAVGVATTDEVEFAPIAR